MSYRPYGPSGTETPQLEGKIIFTLLVQTHGLVPISVNMWQALRLPTDLIHHQLPRTLSYKCPIAALSYDI